MSDERRSDPSTPHMRTRPATMLTAIGLCFLIMLIQLVPEIQDATSRLSAISTSAQPR